MLEILHLVGDAACHGVVVPEVDAEIRCFGADRGAPGLLADHCAAAVADALRIDVLIRVRGLGHRVHVLAALVGERGAADVRRRVGRCDVGNLGDVTRDRGEPAQLLLGDHRDAHFHLQVGDQRAEIGVARALPVSVDAALHLHRAAADRRERVGHRAAGVVVAVDADDTAKPRGDIPHQRFDSVRQRAAVGVAERQPLRAGAERGVETAQRVIRVAVLPVEEVLGVEYDTAILLHQPAYRVRDHAQVLVVAGAQHIRHLAVPRLAHQRDDRRAGVEQRAQLQVVLGPHLGPPRGAERSQLRMLQSMAAHGGKVLGVGWVGAGPAAFDDGDAEVVEQLGDAQLVGHREVDADALRAVTQCRVVDLQRGHEGAPTVSRWRETSRCTASPISPV